MKTAVRPRMEVFVLALLVLLIIFSLVLLVIRPSAAVKEDPEAPDPTRGRSIYMTATAGCG